MKHKGNDERNGLVLNRNIGEEIYVEHGLLIIQVIQIRGKQVRLKFIGNCQVHRKEVIDKMIAAGEL